MAGRNDAKAGGGTVPLFDPPKEEGTECLTALPSDLHLWKWPLDGVQPTDGGFRHSDKEKKHSQTRR